jgi:hypothetical protein
MWYEFVDCECLQTVTEDKYEVKRCVEEAAIIVTAEKDPSPSCTITLTSPIMREANLPEGGKPFPSLAGAFCKGSVMPCHLSQLLAVVLLFGLPDTWHFFRISYFQVLHFLGGFCQSFGYSVARLMTGQIKF